MGSPSERISFFNSHTLFEIIIDSSVETFAVSPLPDHSFVDQHIVLAKMGDYSINLKFTSEQIKKYNGEGLKLCFASGVAESSDYNMVAWCDSKISISAWPAYTDTCPKPLLQR